MSEQEYDYVVVGAGSAGCVVAHRLVKAGHKVLLLEAGPEDDSRFIQMPATFVRVIGTERTWVYESEPQPGAEGRRMHVPQGRTLGGGSSVNAMVYIRGTPADYEDWAAQGCTGWGWQEVLPFFKRAEANQRLSEPLHGVDGPLRVSDPRHRHPLSLAFVKAAQEAGLAYNDDFNGARQEGVGFYQTTTFDGQRGSTAATYLAAVRQHPALTVRTGAHVLKLLNQDREITGVLYLEGGVQHRARARREVILSAGALATPKLLQLSGIGAGAQLQALGITPLHELPGVGENFQDHLEISAYGRCREPISLLGNDRGLAALKHGLQWMSSRSGLLSSTVVESGGFVDTLGQGRPDVQFHVLPVLVGDVDRAPLEGHGLSINPCFLRPRSRGSVRLRSADPTAPILFDAGALSHQDDVDTLVRGLKLARRILRAPSMRAVVDAELARAVAELKVGDGLEPGVAQGPLIDAAALHKVEELVADVLARGGRLVSGGRRHALGGTFYEPTVLAGVTPAMRIAREEVFGPVAPLFRFSSDAEAIRMANDTEFGLAAYLYTRDQRRIWRVSGALEYGMVGINTGLISTAVAPFGGVKQSGMGREGSRYGIEDYLDTKYLCMGGV